MAACESTAATAEGWVLILCVFQSTTISIILVLVSFANVAYLFTRRRRYHLVLHAVRPLNPKPIEFGRPDVALCYHQDPLSSPNARTATLDFSPPKPKLTLTQQLKKRAAALFWTSDAKEPHLYKIQELDIWTPDYVKWSLRIFS